MAKAKGSTALAVQPKGNTNLARPMEDWEIELQKEAKEALAKEAAGLPRVSKTANVIKIDGAPVKDGKLRCVIVDYIFTHTYFKEKYVEGKGGSPDCYAYGAQDNGLSPQEGCRAKQSAQCDGCPHNAYKTSENGKGKACPGGRKLALVIPNEDPDSLAAAELRVLTANAGSLKNWGAYLRAIEDVSPSGAPISVVTEITTEPKGQVFVWNFKPVERLDSEQVKAIMKLRQRARTALMQPWPDIGEEEKPQPAKRRGVKGQ
jgi:hypothetical protein